MSKEIESALFCTNCGKTEITKLVFDESIKAYIGKCNQCNTSYSFTSFYSKYNKAYS